MATQSTLPSGKPNLPPGKQHRAFRGQAYPTAIQREVLQGWFGSSRYVYNALLHLMQYSYLSHQGNWEAIAKLRPRPDLECLYDLMAQDEVYDEYLQRSYKVSANKGFFSYLVSCLKSHPDKAWLHQVPRDVLTYSAEGLYKAFQSFYRLVKLRHHIGPQGLIGFPQYKSRRSRQSIRMQGFNTEVVSYGTRRKRHDVWLPQSRGLLVAPGYLKVKGLRKLQGRQLSVAISLNSAGEYNVSVLTEVEPRVRLSGIGTIGIDLSAQQAEVGYCQDDTKAFSLCQVEELPKAIPTLEARIQHLQQLLARKTKGSERWRATKLRLAKAHLKLQRIYEGYYHRLSHWLIQTYDTIVIEDLDVKGMLQKGHSSLSKLVQDSRFSLFRQLLSYKASQSQHTVLGIADRYYPSTQLCSSCGGQAATRLPLHIKSWTCETCGAQHHRDYNAARNLYQLREQLVAIPAESHIVLLEPYRL